MDENEQHLLMNKKWENRRRQSWLSFFMLIILVLMAATIPEKISKVEGLLMFIAGTFASIVLAYHGLSTTHDLMDKRDNHGQ